MADTVPDLDAIRARAEAATEGPWHPFSEHGRDISDEGWSVVGVRKSATLDVAHTYPVGSEHDECEADAEFIAHAREDVPALLAEVERLRAQQKAALALHAPTLTAGGGDAVWCDWDTETWPCATVRALTGDATP